MTLTSEPRVSDAEVAAFEIPTQAPESDGTLRWSATTLVLVELACGEYRALGYTYADRATAVLIKDKLLPVVLGANPFSIPQLHSQQSALLRNLGQTALSAMALAAVDNALWDLKAKLMHVPLVALLGQFQPRIVAYASGGFTSMSLAELAQQVSTWAEQGFRAVKIKVGREPDTDIARVRTARHHLPPSCALFVDANGAYTPKQALYFAQAFADYDVRWFEEPVRSTNVEGLAWLRSRGPAGMAVSAGEYGWDSYYFRRMLAAQAVDVLQADVTRCGGVSGYLSASALCAAADVPLSSHCAPALHVHCCCASQPSCHLEYFHDHARIENKLFANSPQVQDGTIAPDLSQHGFGLRFKRADAEPFKIH